MKKTHLPLMLKLFAKYLTWSKAEKKHYYFKYSLNFSLFIRNLNMQKMQDDKMG